MGGKKIIQEGETIDEDNYNFDAEKGTPIPDEELLNQSSSRNTFEHFIGVFGNLGLLRRDMSTVKEQMQDLRRDFDHLNKTNQGELTLGQHLDKLMDVIGSAKEVTKIMKRVPPLEAKSRVMDQTTKDI